MRGEIWKKMSKRVFLVLSCIRRPPGCRMVDLWDLTDNERGKRAGRRPLCPILFRGNAHPFRRVFVNRKYVVLRLDYSTYVELKPSAPVLFQSWWKPLRASVSRVRIVLSVSSSYRLRNEPQTRKANNTLSKAVYFYFIFLFFFFLCVFIENSKLTIIPLESKSGKATASSHGKTDR